MSEAVEIQRFITQYRLRPSQFHERRRLDGLIPKVTGAIELALERAGIGPNEIICIRSIHLPVRLRLSLTDSGLVAAWAGHLAEALAAAALDPNLAVRYGSRSLALVAMGGDISKQRFHRVWAWRQAGFWRGSVEAVSLAGAALQLAGALAAEGELAVPVLVALASQGLLRTLAAHWDDAWSEIAASVLTAAGAPTEKILLEIASPAFGDHKIESLHAPESSLALRRAFRILERSRVLADCRAIHLSEAAVRVVAALALLETEPSLVRSGSAEFVEAQRAVCELLSLPRPAVRDSPARVPSKTAAPPIPAAKAGFSAKPLGRKPSEPGAPEVQTTLRREAFTAFGGLLFLLRLENELGIPERVLASPVIALRGLPWFQHRLALALQPMEPADPAVLVFCGLPPDAEHPSLDEPAPSPQEEEFVEARAAQIRSALAEVLSDPAADPARLLQFVCRREARIVADPGWIEVRLSLDSVTLEIRRAGLDLNPNYVPWLGVVVKFVYE